MSDLNGNLPAGGNQPQQVTATPFTVRTAVLPAAGGNIVMISVDTVIGTFSVFADPKTALAIGKNIASAGKSAATGLMLPPSTNGHGVLLDKDE